LLLRLKLERRTSCEFPVRRGDDIDQRGIDDSQEDLDLVPHREEVAWDTKGTGEATAESSGF
jgi:hypothetical protein